MSLSDQSNRSDTDVPVAKAELFPIKVRFTSTGFFSLLTDLRQHQGNLCIVL